MVIGEGTAQADAVPGERLYYQCRQAVHNKQPDLSTDMDRVFLSIAREILHLENSVYKILNKAHECL